MKGWIILALLAGALYYLYTETDKLDAPIAQTEAMVKKIENKEVYFQDGKHENFDTIIAATGYKISFPFFSKQFIHWEEGDSVPLYLRMFHPEYKNLIFIGLFQPQGAVWPLSDYQAKLAAKYIMKKWKPEGDVKLLAEKDANDISKEFLSAKRHTIEVHYQSFMNKLKNYKIF